MLNVCDPHNLVPLLLSLNSRVVHIPESPKDVPDAVGFGGESNFETNCHHHIVAITCRLAAHGPKYFRRSFQFLLSDTVCKTYIYWFPHHLRGPDLFPRQEDEQRERPPCSCCTSDGEFYVHIFEGSLLIESSRVDLRLLELLSFNLLHRKEPT